MFISYGVGPRHRQNTGCSKSTAKTQLQEALQLTGCQSRWSCVRPFPAQLLLSSSPLTPRLLLTLPLCHCTGHVVQQHTPSHGRLTLTSSWRAEQYLLESCRSWVLRISQQQAVGVSRWAKTLPWLNPQLLLQPKDLPSAAAFTTQQPESWLWLIVNSTTEQSKVFQCLNSGQSDFQNMLQFSYVCSVLRISLYLISASTTLPLKF